MRGGLLNPPADLALAQGLIRIAREHLQGIDQALTTTVLTQEVYLQKIGARKHLAGVIDQMESAYRGATQA